MLQCHTGARGWINCYLTLLDRVLERNAIFLLENHCLVLVFIFLSPPASLQWWGSIKEGVLLKWNQARQIRGGGGRDSTVGWTALLLSSGSVWCLAKLTEPILSGCHCNINTHLEQMWLKAWNIEQTAATDPVPSHEHLCSINAVCSWGREGSLYSPQFFGRWVKWRHCGDAIFLLQHDRLRRSTHSTPTWPLHTAPFQLLILRGNIGFSSRFICTEK